MYQQPSHGFSCWVEQQGAGGYRHVGDGATVAILPELHRSPNPSSKSSSSLSAAATFALPPAAAHGGVAAVPFGMAPPGVVTTADDARFCMPWAAPAPAAAHFANWGESGIVVTSPLAETASTDVDEVSGGNHHDAQMGGAMTQSVDGHENSLPVCKVESGDHKAQRRLAQNREAARKSRMRRKAYIAELENSRSKGVATRTDVFHVLSGMWMSPAERFFMWLGGFRSSELLKVVARQVEPQLTEPQLVGICSLQQSLQQAEDALSQGMEALQQALGDTLAAAAAPLANGPSASAADSVTNYMGQMAVAMSKLATVENFLRQADLLRQQTLRQVHRILTTRQAARALLAVSDYFSRLRALSSLWLTRPTD